MSSLARLATQMFAMVLAAVVLLAAAGSLIDHHFAERQSGHLHLPSSSLAAHTHTYQSGMHLHAPPQRGLRSAGGYLSVRRRHVGRARGIRSRRLAGLHTVLRAVLLNPPANGGRTRRQADLQGPAGSSSATPYLATLATDSIPTRKRRRRALQMGGRDFAQ